MPKFKKIVLRPSRYSPNDADYVDVQININKNGVFYCNLPTHLESVVQASGNVLKNGSWLSQSTRSQEWQLFCASYAGLVDDLHSSHAIATEPKVSRKLKIAYLASSNIQFAIDDNGNIFKNATKNGTKWHCNEINRAKHSNHSFGSYDISFNARVVVEVTKVYGDVTKIEYDNMHCHPDLLTPEIEALNQWVRLELPLENLASKFNLVDYTPQLAIFFDKLIMGMAQIAKQFYDFFGEDEHVNLINGFKVETLLLSNRSFGEQ